MTNLLDDTDGRLTFRQYAVSDHWVAGLGEDGEPILTTEVETIAGVPYVLEFSTAVNLAAGATSAVVEVMFAGEVIGTFTQSGAVYARQEIALEGTGTSETLSFRIVDASTADETTAPIDVSGIIPSYERALTVGGESIAVRAFAPGQSLIYQVLNGQLVKFDLESRTYTAAETPRAADLNAIGFNVEDDLLYGLARQPGTDARGEKLADGDLVAIDATGATYRIGATGERSYIGDFDDNGNLWVFSGDLTTATAIDVNALGPDGTPKRTTYELGHTVDNTSGLADLAFDRTTGTFYGIAHGGKDGREGTLVAVDVGPALRGEAPKVTEIPIVATMVPAQDGVRVVEGVPSMAFGAVILDGDGNVYVGGNAGDHDLDRATPPSGGFYRVVRDTDGDTAMLELLSDAPRVSSNDGAMDARGYDPFLGVDSSSTVLLRAPQLSIAIAEDDVVQLSSAGVAATIDLLANDFVSEGGTLSLVTVGGQAARPGETVVLDNGATATVTADGRIEVRAGRLESTRAASLEYTIETEHGIADTGTLTVTVSPVDGSAGNDHMVRGFTDGEGNVVDGADGPDDVILGYGGNDKIFAGGGDDLVDGGEGNDFMRGEAGGDTIRGGTGNDVLDGGAGDDVMSGGLGNDIFFVDSLGDVLVDDGGRDTIKSRVSWTLADDFEDLWLQGDAVVGEGNDGSNTIVGNALANTLVGGEGDDKLLAGDGDDVLSGDAGNDRIDGNDGADLIFGGSGNDKLDGGAGSDTIDGGSGNDSIGSGAAGPDAPDVVTGGTGNDVLYGGEGAQHFYFAAGDGADVIKGFESGLDLIVLDGIAPDALEVRHDASGSVIDYADGSIRLSVAQLEAADVLLI